MPLTERTACPTSSREHDHDLIWLSQVLSPSCYGVTPFPPTHGRARDCLTEVVEAQLAPPRTRHEVCHAWATIDGAGHA